MSEQSSVTCPSCNGKGTQEVLLCSRAVSGRSSTRFEHQACRRCGGAKTVTPEVAGMAAMGLRHRLARVARMETGAKCAARLEVSVVTLAKAEAGYIALAGVSVPLGEAPDA